MRDFPEPSLNGSEKLEPVLEQALRNSFAVPELSRDAIERKASAVVDVKREKIGNYQQKSWASWAIGVCALIIVVLGVNHIRSIIPVKDTEQNFQTYTTARGQRASITLSDGTRVMLNVASNLRVPKDFGHTTRDIYLEGEAQFDVTHNATVPFSVHAGKAVIRDLATVFGVRAYHDQNSTQVFVATGRVAVGEHALAAGDLGVVTSDGTTSITRDASAEEYLGWTSSKLVFRKTPVRIVIAQLSRWYNVDFVLANTNLGNREITTTISGERLSEAELQSLSLVLGVPVERHGNTITLGSK